MSVRYEVTIGIIFMNPQNYDKFVKALYSILSKRYFISIHLVLIDNTGSDFFVVDETTKDPYLVLRRKTTQEPLLLQFKDYVDFDNDSVQYIKNAECKSVAENWNTIYKVSNSPVVIFCNDDIIVNEYYDRILFNYVFGNPMGERTDIASYCEVYPYPQLLIDGWNQEKCVDGGRKGLWNTGMNGACWATRRSVLEEVAKFQPNKQPFDTRYKLACYEDLDFYMTATRNLRLDFGVVYDSFIFHYGASTRNSDMVKELQNKQMGGSYHIDYNKKVFQEKWKLTDDQLHGLENSLYKGWNINHLNHIVKQLADAKFGERK